MTTEPQAVLDYLDEHATPIAAMLEGLTLSPADTITALRDYVALTLPEYDAADTLAELDAAIARLETDTVPESRVTAWMLVVETMPSPDSPPTMRGYRVTSSGVTGYAHARGLTSVAADLVERGELS